MLALVSVKKFGMKNVAKWYMKNENCVISTMRPSGIFVLGRYPFRMLKPKRLHLRSIHIVRQEIRLIAYKMKESVNPQD